MESPFYCAICGASGADRAHAKYGIICKRCDEGLPKICDFCSSKEIAYRYPARTFVTDPVLVENPNPLVNLGTRSIADWAACEPCAELIEQYQYTRLAQRSLDTLELAIELSVQARRFVLETITKLQRQFWENRTGERFRIDN
jgi:hypothetical protein